MSGWDAYINALKSAGIENAAIFGKEPFGAWAQSGQFYQAGEIETLSAALNSQASFDNLPATGFKINGVKYMAIGSEFPSIIRGKQGENACAVVSSGKAIIVVQGKGSPQVLSGPAEKLADGLKKQGF